MPTPDVHIRSKSLLDELLAQSGLEYLSDLHRPDRHAAVRAALAAVEADAYPQEEWSRAAAYITGGRAACGTAAAAREALLRFTAEEN